MTLTFVAYDPQNFRRNDYKYGLVVCGTNSYKGGPGVEGETLWLSLSQEGHYQWTTRLEGGAHWFDDTGEALRDAGNHPVGPYWCVVDRSTLAVYRVTESRGLALERVKAEETV